MRKIRVFALACLLALLTSTAHAQYTEATTGSITTSSTDCTTAAACVSLQLRSTDGSLSLKISGTYSATLQFESSVDGTTWAGISGDPLPSGSRASSTTSTGTWVFNVAGLGHFRVRASAYTSGTASIALRPSAAAARVTSLENLSVLNNIRYCDQFAGADAGAKIAACIADLPATGGTADARGLEGAQTISAQVLVSGKNNVQILLGAATFTYTGTAGAASNSAFKFSGVTGGALIGQGREATKINADSGAPQKDNLVTFQSTTKSKLVGVTLDCNANCTDSFYTDNDNDTWVDDLYLVHDITLQTPAVTRNYAWRVSGSQGLAWGSVEIKGGQLDGLFIKPNQETAGGSRDVKGLRGGTLYVHDAVLNGVDVTGDATGGYFVKNNDFGFLRLENNGQANAGVDDEFGINIFDNVTGNFFRIEASGNKMHGVRLATGTTGAVVSGNVFWINSQGNGVGTGGGNALNLTGLAGSSVIENKFYGTLREAGTAGNHALATDARSHRNYFNVDVGSSTASIAGDGNILFGPTSATQQIWTGNFTTNGQLNISSDQGTGTSLGKTENTNVSASGMAAWQMKTGASANVWQMFTRNNILTLGIEGIADYMYLNSIPQLVLGSTATSIPATFNSFLSTDGESVLGSFVNSLQSSGGSTDETSSVLLSWRDAATGVANGTKILAGKEADYTTAANADSYLAFYTTLDNTLTERMRLNSVGNLTTAIKTLTPQASAPATPTSGMMYMDATPTPDELCVYDGAGWQALITGTDGNCA